jgi:hypothetical protein
VPGVQLDHGVQAAALAELENVVDEHAAHIRSVVAVPATETCSPGEHVVCTVHAVEAS